LDSSTLLALVIAVAAGLVVGGIPLLTVIRSRAALNAAIARTPAWSPPRPDDLKPEELAYLAGGPVRAAETVIMDLYLSGRIRQQAARGFFTLVGPAMPYAHEKSLIRRAVIRGYRDRLGLTAREMIRRAVASRGMIGIADGLKASRLRVDSPGLNKILVAREKVPSRIRWMRTLSLLVAIVAGGFYLFDPAPVALGLLVGGFLAAVMLSVDKAVLDSTGGAFLLATTPAGRAVVAEAKDRYRVVAESTAELDRELAVRYTAVTGFRALRDVIPDADPTAPATRRASSAPGSSGGHGSAGGGEYTVGDSVHLMSLCEFAEVCQGESGGSGSSSSGDGWGGDFSGGGHGDGGGGGGGSDSGGSGGGSFDGGGFSGGGDSGGGGGGGGD
jgi:uncharacterized protein (TIGR04222 family)